MPTVNLNPILNFNGNTEEAFIFYKTVFGGEFQTLMRWKDGPNCGDMPDTVQNNIMHIALPLGKSSVLMGNDVPESMDKVTFGNNFTICIEPENEKEADRIFTELSAGGQVFMPMQKMFWNAYAGMFMDKFDVRWMVNYSYK